MSFAALAAKGHARQQTTDEDLAALLDEQVAAVDVDAMVLLKIAEHCHDELPELVTGQLLGTELDNTVDVSNCFRFMNQTAQEASQDEDSDMPPMTGAEYQMEMLKAMGEINADASTMGWYQSTHLGSFVTQDTIKTQYNYQSMVRDAVMLIYDPMRTEHGAVSLRAFRLSPEFMALYKGGKFTQEAMDEHGVTYANVLVELPVRIVNTPLTNALLFELEATQPELLQVDADMARLNLAGDRYIERTMDFLQGCVDQTTNDQRKFETYLRNVESQRTTLQQLNVKRQQENLQRVKDGEDPLPAVTLKSAGLRPVSSPNRLDSLLLATQAEVYCKQLNDAAGLNLGKLHVLDSLHDSKKQ